MLGLVRSAAVIIAVVAAIVVAVGFALPQAHEAQRRAIVKAPVDVVFTTLIDVEAYPSWRGGVSRVEVLARAPALRWREHAGNDAITFEFVETSRPLRLVSKIADPSLPFGGTWTYQLTPTGGGTAIVVIEHGEVYNPIFRFMSRFVFGHTATIARFLDDLDRRFAGTTTSS